jgi:hypothetical protein
MRLNAVSENLQISKSCGLRKHWRLFEYARSLKKQRNWITHRFGLPGPQFPWDHVWHRVISKLEKELLLELTQVIEKEKGKDSIDGNQKSTNQTPDSLDTPSSPNFIQTKTTDKFQSMDSEDSED